MSSSPFIDEETETYRGEGTCQGYTKSEHLEAIDWHVKRPGWGGAVLSLPHAEGLGLPEAPVCFFFHTLKYLLSIRHSSNCFAYVNSLHAHIALHMRKLTQRGEELAKVTQPESSKARFEPRWT